MFAKRSPPVGLQDAGAGGILVVIAGAEPWVRSTDDGRRSRSPEAPQLPQCISLLLSHRHVILNRVEHRSVASFGESFECGCLHNPALVPRRVSQCHGRSRVRVSGHTLAAAARTGEVSSLVIALIAPILCRQKE